jgi:phosphomannomutase/phosphoglucomutase
MSVFKACDVRGVYPDDLDEDLVRDIGRALGTEMGGGTCIVGGDVRPSTPSLKNAVAQGLVASGVHVTDVGIAPTPSIHWARAHLGTDAVVIVTASHNPAEYNGVKFALGPHPPTPEVVEALRQRVQDGDFASGEGSIRTRRIRTHYLDWLAESFDGCAKGLRVLVDAGNGSASCWAPEALRMAGCEVEELFCEPDGTFPHRSPNPAVPETLEKTGRVVAEHNVDFAVAFDGDGDRAVFVDGRGSYMESDEAVILLARDALGRDPGSAVIYDQKCSERVGEEIRKAGGRPIRERSGYAFIKNRLLEEDAAFAGEASGHFFFREVGGDDAIYAALRMAKLVRDSGRSLAELRETVPARYITPDIRLPRPEGDGQAVIEHLKQRFSNLPQDYIDGVRIRFEDGWALCRESVTEPVITIRVEGDTPEAMERLRELVLGEIEKA